MTTTPRNPESVDIRDIASSDFNTAVDSLQTIFVGARQRNNAANVEKALRLLNELADIARRIHL